MGADGSVGSAGSVGITGGVGVGGSGVCVAVETDVGVNEAMRSVCPWLKQLVSNSASKIQVEIHPG